MSTQAPGQQGGWVVDAAPGATSDASDGWLPPSELLQLRARASRPVPWQGGAQPPTFGDASTTGLSTSAHELLTVSTGSVPLDAAAGALAGYLVSPQSAGRAGYALAGAAATGLFGVVGLLGVLGWAWWHGRGK